MRVRVAGTPAWGRIGIAGLSAAGLSENGIKGPPIVWNSVFSVLINGLSVSIVL